LTTTAAERSELAPVPSELDALTWIVYFIFLFKPFIVHIVAPVVVHVFNPGLAIAV
jgi:hypothetical protein